MRSLRGNIHSLRRRAGFGSSCARRQGAPQRTPQLAMETASTVTRHMRCPEAVSGVVCSLPSALSASVPGITAGTLANSIFMAAGLGVLRRGLSNEGIFNAWVLGNSVYGAFGSSGYAVVCLYFVLGTAVTKVRQKQKEEEGIAEAQGGRRGPGSVWGSGVAGFACALAAMAGGAGGMGMSVPALAWRAGFLASMASKLGDTASSEVGKAYGRTTYLITSLALVPRGTEGAVSLEGTAAGAASVAFLVAVGASLGVVDWGVTAPVCVGAAIFANLFESWLGATLQGKEGVEWLTNDIVNGIQVSLAALIAVIITCIIS